MAKHLLRNISYLSLVQWANYLLPLLVIPYITRILGPAGYGWVEVAQSLALYGIILINYGFEIAGSRAVAQIGRQPAPLSTLLSSITRLKLYFFGAYLLTTLAVLAYHQSPTEHWILFLGAGLMPLGHALTPNWLFQGLEDVKPLVGITLAGKALALLPVFIWITTPEDYIWVPFWFGLGQVLPGLLLLQLARKRYHLEPKPVHWRETMPLLREGLPLFLVHAAAGLNTYLMLLLLRNHLSEQELGYFAAAQKVYLAGLAVVLMPIGQALFPRLVKTLQTDGKQAFAQQLKQLLKRTIPLFSVACAAGAYLAPAAGELLFGPDFGPTGAALQPLAWSVLGATLTSVLGYQGMLALGADNRYLAIHLIILAGWVLVFVAVPPAHALGAGLFRLGIELVLALATALGFWVTWRRYPNAPQNP
jgi:PST family polysaccharide transporter